MHLGYKELQETIGGITARIAGENAPSVGRALDTITKALSDNQAAIDGWAKGANNALNSFLDGISGKMDVAGAKISAFNGKLSADNAKSADSEVRAKEMDERKKSAFWQDVGVNANLLYSVAKNLGGAAWDTGAGAVTFDWKRIEGGWTSAADEIGKSVSDAFEMKGKLLDSLDEARRGNLEAMYGPDYAAFGERVKGMRQRQIPERLQSTAKPEIRYPEQFHSADLAMLDINAAEMAGSFDYLNAESFKTPMDESSWRSLEEFNNHLDKMNSAAFNSWQMPELPKIVPNVSGLPQQADFDRRLFQQEIAYIPNSPAKAGAFAGPAPDMSPHNAGYDKGGGGSSGVTIQQQHVTINIDGTGDPEMVAMKTAEQLDLAAKRGDYLPFIN